MGLKDDANKRLPGSGSAVQRTIIVGLERTQQAMPRQHQMTCVLFQVLKSLKWNGVGFDDDPDLLEVGKSFKSILQKYILKSR